MAGSYVDAQQQKVAEGEPLFVSGAKLLHPEVLAYPSPYIVESGWHEDLMSAFHFVCTGVNEVMFVPNQSSDRPYASLVEVPPQFHANTLAVNLFTADIPTMQTDGASTFIGPMQCVVLRDRQLHNFVKRPDLSPSFGTIRMVFVIAWDFIDPGILTPECMLRALDASRIPYHAIRMRGGTTGAAEPVSIPIIGEPLHFLYNYMAVSNVRQLQPELPTWLGPDAALQWAFDYEVRRLGGLFAGFSLMVEDELSRVPAMPHRAHRGALDLDRQGEQDQP
jgi:hypothetical protein